MGEVVLTSTTDTEAQMREALGLPEDPNAGQQPPANEQISVGAKIEKDGKPAAEPAATEQAPDGTETEGDDDAEPDAEAISEAGRTLAKSKKIPQRSLLGRITKLQATVEALKGENANLHQRLTTPPQAPPAQPQQTPPAEAPPPAPPEPTDEFAKPKPKQDDFDDFDKYLDARDQWVEERTAHQLAVAQRKHAEETAAERQRVEYEQRQRQQEAVFAGRLDAARAAHPDWDEVAESAAEIPANDLVLFHIRQSELGPELAYYLAKNPDVTEQLNQLSPAPLLVALGRIEGRLANAAPSAAEAPKPRQAAPPARPVSKALPPVARIGAGTVAASKDPNEMTFEEHKAWRKAGGGR